MLIGWKSALKQSGVVIACFCAAFVCSMFANYMIDIHSVAHLISDAQAAAMYEAQKLTSIVVCALSGGCLAITSAVMLSFYIGLYVRAHSKELGVLKALGYSEWKISFRFLSFALGAFVGCGAGFALSFAAMPAYYSLQSGTGLPAAAIRFHPALLVYAVVLPALFFGVWSVACARKKLSRSAVDLLRERTENKPKKTPAARAEKPFLRELRGAILRRKKLLAFFVAFSAFCFSAMTQMSFSMENLSSLMMALMIALIGITLAATSLYMAISSLVRANAKTAAILRSYGYTRRECAGAVFGGFRLIAYVGFALGTLYQYGLLKIMVSVVFQKLYEGPAYEFNFTAFIISLAIFAAAYEAVVYLFSRRFGGSTLKRVMEE